MAGIGRKQTKHLRPIGPIRVATYSPTTIEADVDKHSNLGVFIECSFNMCPCPALLAEVEHVLPLLCFPSVQSHGDVDVAHGLVALEFQQVDNCWALQGQEHDIKTLVGTLAKTKNALLEM